MKSLSEITGVDQDVCLSDYTLVTNLIEFDGPLLSLYSKDKEQVLFSWCDAASTVDRWCIIPVDKDLLHGFLSGNKTLLNVFQSSEQLLVFDLEGTNVTKSIVTTWKELPSDCLPMANSYLNQGLGIKDHS